MTIIDNNNVNNKVLSVKLEFYGELRRFTTSGTSFESLVDEITNVLRIGKDKPIVIKYRDEEGDLITMSTELELKSAIASQALLRLFVTYKTEKSEGQQPQPQVVISVNDVNMEETQDSAPRPAVGPFLGYPHLDDHDAGFPSAFGPGALSAPGFGPGAAPPAFGPGVPPPPGYGPGGPFCGPLRGHWGHFGGRGGFGPRGGFGGRGGFGRGGWDHHHSHPHGHHGHHGHDHKSWKKEKPWKTWKSGEAPAWAENQDALAEQVMQLGFDVKKEKVVKLLWKFDGNVNEVANHLAWKKEKKERKATKREMKAEWKKF